MNALPPANSTSAPPLILLTGGIRDHSTMTTVLAEKHAHLLGVGRLSVLVPDLPIQLKKQGSNFVPPPLPDMAAQELDLSFIKSTNIRLPKLFNAGVECAWYFLGMKSMAVGVRKIDHGNTEALIRMWCWIAPRTGFESGYNIWKALVVIFPILILLVAI
jgi:hypothetical protein